MPSSPAYATLDREHYLSLTTVKRDGTSVATAIWFAVDGDRLVMVTGATSGKVKRLRNNPRVTVAVCDGRGKVKGPALAGTAVILPAADEPRAQQLIARKYGVQRSAISALNTVMRVVKRSPKEEVAALEVTLDEAPGA